MSNESIAVQIGQAWKSYREGRSDAAVNEFERILKNHADDADANYGLGLAQQALGMKEAAAQSFKRALEVVSRVEPTSQEERDRSMMLTRMIKQRLEELGSGAQQG